MELLKDALLSRNIIAWAMLLLVVVLFLKLLQTASKGLVLGVGVSILVFLLFRYFPEVVGPMVDWVRDNWLPEAVEEVS
jgi:hypothetical protein